jgi:hypothetical protein
VALPAWFLVRRLIPGQAGFARSAAAFWSDESDVGADLAREGAQLFALSDPAADGASEPAAVALVQPLGDAVSEIRLAAGSPGTALGRLLIPVLDALRAQGMRKAVSRSETMDENVTAVLRHVGFRSHGEYLALEL